MTNHDPRTDLLTLTDAMPPMTEEDRALSIKGYSDWLNEKNRLANVARAFAELSPFLLWFTPSEIEWHLAKLAAKLEHQARPHLEGPF